LDSFFCFARDSSANKNTTEGRYVIEMIAEKNNKKEAVYFILMFLTYYGSNALFWEFIVVYLTDAGYTATFAGGLITITYLINLLVQPVVGVFSDKLGSPRKILLLFAVLLAPSAYLLSCAINLPWLLVAAMIYLAVFDNPMCSLLDSYAVKNQERLGITYGLIRASGSLGYGLALVLGGGLINRFYFTGAFHLRCALLAAMVLFILLQRGNKPVNFSTVKNSEKTYKRGIRKKFQHNQGEMAKVSQCSVENSVDKVEKNYISLIAFLKSRQYAFVLLVVLVYQTAVRVFSTFSPILIQEFGGDSSTIGAIGGFSCLIQIPVMIFAGRKASGAASVKLYLVVFALLIFRCALLWAYPSITAMFIGTIIQQAAGALSSVISVQLFYQYSPRAMESTGITMGQAAASSIAVLVGNLLGGVATDAVSPMAIVALSGVFAAIGLALVLWGNNKLKAE